MLQLTYLLDLISSNYDKLHTANGGRKTVYRLSYLGLVRFGGVCTSFFFNIILLLIVDRWRLELEAGGRRKGAMTCTCWYLLYSDGVRVLMSKSFFVVERRPCLC